MSSPTFLIKEKIEQIKFFNFHWYSRQIRLEEHCYEKWYDNKYQQINKKELQELLDIPFSAKNIDHPALVC